MKTAESAHGFKATNLPKVEALEEFTFVANGCIAHVGVEQVQDVDCCPTFIMVFQLQHYWYSKEFWKNVAHHLF